MTSGVHGALLLVLAAKAAAAPVATPAFLPDKLRAIDQAIERAVSEHRAPGAVLWLEHDGQRYVHAYGRRALLPAEERMSEDTIFDAASLTKVVATTTAALKLIERGAIRLEDPLTRHLAECEDKGAITVHHLLTHTSGLAAGLPRTPPWEGTAAAIRLACGRPALARPGEVFRYSDVNYILLGEIVSRVSGKSLADFTEREIFRPLGMTDTGYNPPASKRARIAPTEKVGEDVFRGVVHDPLARVMGGVAGHAGLFTTAADLARFARMLLGGGSAGAARILRPETVRLMTSVQTPVTMAERRGLGWDIDTGHSGPAGRHFPIGSYGHTGWTGTSIWIDPGSRTFVILLSNRNHPTEAGNIIALRNEVGTLVAEAVGVVGARRVRTGIDVLEADGFAPLRGLRVGLITNHTGHDRERTPTIDLLAAAPGVELRALFSPEHGLRGQRDEPVPDGRDEKTGLPVYSLYGHNRAPTAAQLEGLDALVYDIQNIGCRFYTYETTLGLALEAAGKAGLRFIVLDRPNPIGGVAVEGPVMTSPSSFIGFHPVPLRHGLTMGELARLFNEERGIHARLTVIAAEGWRRATWLDETGLPWTNPSPAMRSLAAATLYPGVGLLESAVSVGRGTDTPFEIVGAPYVDDVRLANELNGAGLAGVRFVPVHFVPTYSVFKDKRCAGVRITIIDRARTDAVAVGLTLARTLHRLYPQKFALDKVDPLLGHRATLEALRAGKTLAEIRQLWEADLQTFRARRERVLIYR